MQRDIAEHKRRRQPWNRAFGREAMEGYQTIVIDSARELLLAFGKREKEVVDLGLWMTYFA
jgi:cytochrome P450